MMFKDYKEQNFFNLIVSNIAQSIKMQIDDIEEQGGEIDFSQITFNVDAQRIDVDTHFFDADDGKYYTVHNEVSMFRASLDFYAKVFYAWLDNFADDFKHGVNFSGWIYPHK